MPGSFQDQDVESGRITFPQDGTVNHNAMVNTPSHSEGKELAFIHMGLGHRAGDEDATTHLRSKS